MARRRNNFAFNDFNFVDGAIDLFNNTIRNSFQYDSMLDDVFEARVITVPTPVTEDATAVAGGDSKNAKHIFRVRILGDKSPHRFLEDPCNLDQASNDVTADQIFSQIQNHTEVFVYDTELGIPKRGDIVRIKLERTANSFNTRKAKQYLGIARDVKESSETTTRVDCGKLDELFKNFDFDTLANPAINEAEARKLVNDFLARLPAIAGFLPPPLTGEVIKHTSTIRTTAEGRLMIYKMAIKQKIQTTATEQSIVNDANETERLRGILTKHPYNQAILPPEASAHNPINGKVAIDLQITGHNKPTYPMISQAVRDYKATMDSNTMPDYSITLILEEDQQGTTRCPEPDGLKCGVVHVELTPNIPFGTTPTTTSATGGAHADTDDPPESVADPYSDPYYSGPTSDTTDL